jgi:superkiller protein 3
MRQYHAQQPSDALATHLMALLAERVRDYDTSVEALQEVCDATEAEYEQSESNEYLVKYAQAKADLARSQLACGKFADAVMNAETAIDLSGEDGELSPTYEESRKKWRLSAHITIGLAHSHLKQVEPSIKMFEAALKESNEDPDVVCMLAQVLWAKGGSLEKKKAGELLWGVVENHPGHVIAISLLAVTGLLDEGEDVLEAVEEELKSLRQTDGVGVLDNIRITKVLAGIAGCRQKAGSEVDAVADALNGIMLAPGQPQGWSALAHATPPTDIKGNEGGDESLRHAAEMAVLNAERLIPPGGNLEAQDLARTYEGLSTTEGLIKAKMVAPWLMGGIQDID